MNIWKKVKRYALTIIIGDPNSSEGLRLRAKWLIEDGCKPNNPYISALCKQILFKEGRRNEIPSKQVLTTTQIVNILEEKR